MKPPPFTYHRPADLDQALRLLASRPNARALAGGQSLMPMLNFRVIAPDHLVDINRVPGLAGIEDRGGIVAIGAMTRQRDLEHSALIARRLPLMAEALPELGHRQTRNRGTLGGSLCHLDPSAELPLVAAALDAEVVLRSVRGERVLAMESFAAGYMTPALDSDELLCEVRFPVWPDRHGHAFVEFARRRGDFAMVAAAAMLLLDDAGRIARASLALGGYAETPLRLREAEARLLGAEPSGRVFAEAAAAVDAVEPLNDPAVPAWYRRHLAGVLARRALALAARRAAGAGTR